MQSEHGVRNPNDRPARPSSDGRAVHSVFAHAWVHIHELYNKVRDHLRWSCAYVQCLLMHCAYSLVQREMKAFYVQTIGRCVMQADRAVRKALLVVAGNLTYCH